MKKIATLIPLIIGLQILVAQKKHTLLNDGVIHLGNGEKYSHGAISFKDGVITSVYDLYKQQINKADFDTVIELNGNHVYPGLIALNSTLGLGEIDAVRATLDQKEIGNFNPDIRSIIAYDAESKIIETVKSNGILFAQITPRGNEIAGKSSVVKFQGKNWKEATIQFDNGLHIYWPSRWKKGKLDPEYKQKVIELEEYFVTALDYNFEFYNHKLESLYRFLKKKGHIYIHSNDAKEMLDAIQLKKKLRLIDLTIIGGADAELILQEIKDNEVSIILRRPLSLPYHTDDDIYSTYKIAKILNEAKILFSFDTSGEMERMNTRNLPYYASSCVHFGLKEEDALKAITLNAAQILNLENIIGSIEPNKKATFFISKGSILQINRSNIKNIYIDGKSTNTTDFQRKLLEKYNH